MAKRADKDRRKRFTVPGRELRVESAREETEKDWIEVGPGRYPPGTTFKSPVTGKEYPADDLRWDVTEDPSEGAQKELVYGEIDESLVFIPRERAEELAALRDALRSSTWGELRAAVSPEQLAHIEERVEDESPAAHEDPFDPDAIAGYSDGDWPEWPAQQMLDWMPRDVAEAHGAVETSVINGEFLHIPAEHRDAIVAALEAKGWRCTADDELVRRASGG